MGKVSYWEQDYDHFRYVLAPPKKITFKNKNSIILCPENLNIGEFKSNVLICLIVIISRQYNSHVVISTCLLPLLRFREKHRQRKMIENVQFH